MTDDFETVQKLDRDLRGASKTLGEDEVRFLVDAYYTMQENRIRANNQVRSIGEGNPHELLEWFATQNDLLERQIKNSLDVYAHNHPVGAWMLDQKGIGPVIASGMLAHIDINKAPTMGHIWSYAGLENGTAWLSAAAAGKAIKDVIGPAQADTFIHAHNILQLATNLNCDPKWLVRRAYRAATNMDIGFKNMAPLEDAAFVTLLLKEARENGQQVLVEHLVKALSRRPWNTQLKTLCWKAGESFVKVSNRDDATYGHIYRERKLMEEANNLATKYKDQAERILATRRIGKDTEAYKHYSVGMLPPAHIHARAKRYAVKQFLADLHTVWYRHAFNKEPPLPYPVAHMGHAHVRRV